MRFPMKGVPRQKYLALVFESAPMGMFTVDSDNRITSFNPSAERLTGYSHAEAIGRRCYEVFRANVCQEDCPLKRSMRTGESTTEREVTILDRTGDEVPISISTAALRSEIEEMDSDLPVFGLRAMPDLVAQSYWPQRLLSQLFVLFSVVGIARRPGRTAPKP